MKVIYDLVSWQAQAIIGLYEEFLAEEEILPVRLLGSPEVVQVTRASMMAREVLAERGEEPLEYDYEAVPYSPTENNRLVQLRNLSQYFELLAASPVVDQDALVRKLLELLQMGDVLKDPSVIAAEQQAMAAQQQQAAGAAPMPPGGLSEEDTRATGALPPGTEPVLPANMEGGAGMPSPAPGFQGAPFALPPGLKGK